MEQKMLPLKGKSISLNWNLLLPTRIMVHTLPKVHFLSKKSIYKLKKLVNLWQLKIR